MRRSGLLFLWFPVSLRLWGYDVFALAARLESGTAIWAVSATGRPTRENGHSRDKMPLMLMGRMPMLLQSTHF
jgi:hypothetical protein